MPNIGLPELAIVLVIALVVFGPKRLPQMGRQLGRAIREFRSATTDLRSELGVDDIADAVNDVKASVSLSGDQGGATATAATAAAATAAQATPTTAAPPSPLVAEVVDVGPAADPPPGDVVDAEIVPEPDAGAVDGAGI